MAYKYEFSEDEVNELLGEDLSIAASLATLINTNGDIRSFLIAKLEEREEEATRFHLSQAPRWMDEREPKESLGIARALGMPTY
jgi:hypothetical protein